MGWEFGSAGAVSGPQTPRVPIVVRASKSETAKGDVPKIYEFVHLVHPC